MPDTPWKVFERTVAKAISLWLSSGKCPQVIARQALVGRMVERIGGDTGIHPKCPAEWLPAARWFQTSFQVDAKNRKKFRLDRLLARPKGDLWNWWEKLRSESEGTGKTPLMVLQHGGMHVAVITPRFFGQVEAVANVYESPWMKIGRNIDEVLHLCEFEKLLDHVEPEHLGCPKPVEVIDA